MPRPRRCVSQGVAAIVATVLAGAGCTSPAGQGRRLRILSPSLPDQLDPTRDSRLGSRNVFLNVFEPLARIDALGRLSPGLAESWSNPAPDLYSFRLREGVRFQDGTPLQASHVVASLAAAQSPTSIFAGNLADAAEIRAGETGTVEVKTRRPTAVLLPALTAVLIGKPASGGLPVGTGPFEIVEFRPGELVRLKRFDGYHGRRPLLDAVTFQRFRDEVDLKKLLAGDEPSAVLDPPRAVVEAIRSDARFRVVGEPSGSLVYLAFSLRKEAPLPPGLARNPFLDPRVRRAVQLAIDLETLIDAAAPHGGVPATQYIPPGVFGFDAKRKPAMRDLERARALLAEAGFPQGFSVPLDVRSNDRALGESLARQLAQVGVRLLPRALSSEEFLERRTSGETLLYAYNWVVGEDSGQALRNFLHTRDEEHRLGLRNMTGYSNPQVDAGLDEALATIDPAKRLLLLQRVIGLLMEDLPWVPLFADKAIRIYPKEIGFTPRLDGTLVLSEAKLLTP